MNLSQSFTVSSYQMSKSNLTEEEALIVYDKLKYDVLDNNAKKVQSLIQKYSFDNIFFSKSHNPKHTLKMLTPLFNLASKEVAQILMDELMKSQQIHYSLQTYQIEQIIYQNDNPQSLLVFLSSFEKINPHLLQIEHVSNHFNEKMIKPSHILNQIFKNGAIKMLELVLTSKQFKEKLNDETSESLLDDLNKDYLIEGRKNSEFYDEEKTKLLMLDKLLSFCPEIKLSLHNGMIKSIHNILKSHNLSNLCYSYNDSHQYFHKLILEGIIFLDKEDFMYNSHPISFSALFDLGQKQISELEKLILEKQITNSSNTKKLKL